MLKVILIYFVFNSINFCQAQSQKNYNPFSITDSIELKRLVLLCSNSVNASYILPQKVKSDYKESFNAYKKSAVEGTTYLVKSTTLLDTIINPYLQNIFEKIIKANPTFKENRLIVSRNSNNNAFAMGDGTLFFNIGLLNSLENDAQIAFVICHELSHGYFNHVQLGLNSYLSKFYSDDVKKEYHKILKSEYNTGKLLNNLMMKVSVSNLYHQRNLESQADSLAFFLMKNTGYDVSQAYSALKTLDKTEDVSYLPSIRGSLFNCNDYNSPELSNTNESSSSIFKVKVEINNSDTLKTHPDCKVRMLAIKKLMSSTGIDTSLIKNYSAPKDFHKVVQTSRYESIQSLYDDECYDKSLYYALLNMNSDLENNYLKTISILSLYQLKYHLIKHEYSNVVSNTNEYNSKSFNDFVIFLNKLNLSDFNQIKNCLNKNYPTALLNDEFTLAANMADAFISENKENAKTKAQEYLIKYPSGRFKKIANNLTK